jgi:ribosomal protein L32
MINKDNYKEMDCPVCGEFHFTELTDDDLEFDDFAQCDICGWINDLHQTNFPNSKEGLNKLSLNEYKIEYANKLKENPNYNFLESKYIKTPHTCPVCGKYQFPHEDSFYVCPYCGWEDDGLMEEEPDQWAGNSNDLCLTDFRKRYEEFLHSKKNYRFDIDGFLKE